MSQDFINGYIEAMFFTSAGPDDEIPSDAELSDDARVVIAVECDVFMSKAQAVLNEAYDTGYTETQAGRDFWFTRNGHGVGFWDRSELDVNGIGERLSAFARSCNEQDAYLGDDGLVYLS